MACTTVVCGRVLTTNVLLRVAALVSPKHISFNSFEEISKNLNHNVLIQALAIVDILLARFGGNDGYTLNLPQNEKWLVIIASGGYVIILGAMVGSYLRGQQVPQFLVKLGSNHLSYHPYLQLWLAFFLNVRLTSECYMITLMSTGAHLSGVCLYLCGSRPVSGWGRNCHRFLFQLLLALLQREVSWVGPCCVSLGHWSHHGRRLWLHDFQL